MIRKFHLLMGLTFLSFATASAQQQHDHSSQHHQHDVGWVTGEILSRPVPLRTGIGSIDDPVSTTSKEAQAFYNQGVAYLHSYVWIEAARSFNQALRIDPNLVMAYVGLSRVYSGLEDQEAASVAQKKAEELSGRATDSEKRRIALRAKQLEAMADPQNSTKHQDYKKAIDDALALDLNNAELWLLRGNAEEATAFGRGQRGGAASVAFYRQVFSAVPDHFAAHHYLIHSYETIDQIQEALKHGEAYARLCSAVPHALHMYGHDLRRVGRIDEAIQMFQQAHNLEISYYREENIPKEQDWHHVHNLNLLATSYLYLGKLKQSEQFLREYFNIPAQVELLELARRDLPHFLLNRGRIEQAIAAAKEMTESKWAIARAAGHALTGKGLLSFNRIEEAKDELLLAEKEADQVKPVGALPVTPQAAKAMIDELRAELAIRTGNRDEGVALLKDVQKRIRGLRGAEPWIHALFQLEGIARIARETGSWDLAEYTANQMLEHDPAYAGSHYAMALVAEHRGNQKLAQTEFAAAQKLWMHADPDLPELSHLRKKLARVTQ